MTWSPRICSTCKSTGFEPSAAGPDRCTFCDGSEGGQGPPDKPTFVIGDVHGHLDRLVRLLHKAGFIDANGDPTAQANIVRVVQLGDLGHYGFDSKDNDLATWRAVQKYDWFHVLMGNHDMCVFDVDRHGFRGYDYPHAETVELMRAKGLSFATAANGYLLTHAGLHPAYVPLSKEAAAEGLVDRAKFMAALINLTCQGADFTVPVRDDIASYRGGLATQGGVLWRDVREALSDIPQVFGHTRAHNVRRIADSWCVDIAEKDSDMLAGIWLPSCKVVTVGSEARFVESEHNEPEWGRY